MLVLRQKDLKKSEELALDRAASIDVNGSLRGMYKIYGWKSENVIKCGRYYYHVTNIDDKRILGLI